MRPKDLHTKIFLDSGDPAQTKEMLSMLGFLDGQTTNPSLITKNPDAQSRLASGEKFSKQEILDFYKNVVCDIREILSEGSISIEVSADRCTSADVMIAQGREMNTWIDGAHIKLPITHEGLKAAHQLVADDINVNMTLNFSQSQAAAVHCATRGAQKGQVFISPFDGRLDDSGVRGGDVIANIVKMYRDNDSHVEVLAASVRNQLSFLHIMQSGVDTITAPFDVLEDWAKHKMPIADGEVMDIDAARELTPVAYEEHGLDGDWRSFDIQHDLTDTGLEKFNKDWEGIMRS